LLVFAEATIHPSNTCRRISTRERLIRPRKLSQTGLTRGIWYATILGLATGWSRLTALHATQSTDRIIAQRTSSAK
jgi:hypothetical protein